LRGDRSIDTLYDIKRETDGTSTIGVSPLSLDEKGDVTVLGVMYEDTEGLWEFLTKKFVERSLVTPPIFDHINAS
jgi:hypothetical protein